MADKAVGKNQRRRHRQRCPTAIPARDAHSLVRPAALAFHRAAGVDHHSAICFKPLHERLMTKRGLSSRWSAIIIGAGLSALVLVPTAIAAMSAASSIPKTVATIESGDRHILRLPRA